MAEMVPAHFGMRRPYDVMEAMYLGRVAAHRVSELAPLVFATADGDSVARSIVDRQADEIVTMATASIHALDMEGLDVDVVLGGGIVRNRLPAFFDRIRDGVARTAPRAAVVVLSSPPLVGAALLALDRVRAPSPAHARVRAGLTHDVLEATATTRTGGGS